jgi:hypothetical protein
VVKFNSNESSPILCDAEMASILFPDIPKQLNETYDFISKVVTDIVKLKRKLSDRELKKLVDDFKKGVETINLICIEIHARHEVAKRRNVELYLNASETSDIENKIAKLTDELNSIVEMDAMNKFFRENPKLAEKAYIKLYGEHEIEDAADLPDFLEWIEAIRYYTGELLSELEKAIEKSLSFNPGFGPGD